MVYFVRTLSWQGYPRSKAAPLVDLSKKKAQVEWMDGQTSHKVDSVHR